MPDTQITTNLDQELSWKLVNSTQLSLLNLCVLVRIRKQGSKRDQQGTQRDQEFKV